MGVGHALFPELCSLWCEWSCLVATMAGTQLLPIQLLAQCSRRRLRPKSSILCTGPHLPAMLGGTLQSLPGAAFYSSWPAGHRGHELYFQCGLIAGRAAALVCGVPAQPRISSLLKKKCLCGTHTAVLSHSLHLPKRHKVSLSHGWPQPAGTSHDFRR